VRVVVLVAMAVLRPAVRVMGLGGAPSGVGGGW
jgi:hypothetical protein